MHCTLMHALLISRRKWAKYQIIANIRLQSTRITINSLKHFQVPITLTNKTISKYSCIKYKY